jgi:predicted Zn-dependent peptidase
MYLKANTDEEIVIVVYTGPCTHESKDTFGVSHLLEHMICNSYKDFTEYDFIK